MPKAECVCDDEPMTGFLSGLSASPAADLAEALADVSDRTCGEFVRSMMGADPDPGDGHPYEHVLRLPETEEEMAAEPFLPSLTIIRATRRGTCRRCGKPVTHGPKGWRDDEDGPLAYGCPDAPLGFHEP